MNRPTSLRISLLALSSLALPTALAQAQLVAYDGFGNFPSPDLAGSTGGTGWTSAWSPASSDVTAIVANGLQYTNLATTPGGARTPTAGGIWPSSIYQRSFPASPAGVNDLYVSFLMRDDAGFGMWGGLSFGQYPYKMTVGSPLGYYTYGLMVSEGLGDVSNKPLIAGETTLVVVRITRNPTGPGVTYRMYLDPAIGSAEPSFPAASFSLGMVTGLPAYLSIDNGTGFTTDEIRVGRTWSSVLPAAPNPWTDLGFAKPGIHGAPHLAGSGPLSAGSVASLSLTNAKENAFSMLFVGASSTFTPFLGGVLVPSPTLAFPLTTNPTGGIGLTSTWPSGVPANSPFFFQFWISDPAATLGVSASNGLRGTTP